MDCSIIGCINTGDDSVILDRNLVRFSLVAPEITTLNCIFGVQIGEILHNCH